MPYKSVKQKFRKLLKGNCTLTCTCSFCEAQEIEPAISWQWLMASLLLLILITIALIVFSPKAHAEEFNDIQIANAIFRAEGGLKTRHPYGILATYKHTTPRQACLNTIKHKRQQWIKDGAQGDFIAYLGSKYCPVGASNDPKGLNRNWVHNVRFFLSQREV